MSDERVQRLVFTVTEMCHQLTTETASSKPDLVTNHLFITVVRPLLLPIDRNKMHLYPVCQEPAATVRPLPLPVLGARSALFVPYR